MPLQYARRRRTPLEIREHSDALLAVAYPDEYSPAGDWYSHHLRGYMPIPRRNEHGRTIEEQAYVLVFKYGVTFGLIVGLSTCAYALWLTLVCSTH